MDLNKTSLFNYRRIAGDKTDSYPLLRFEGGHGVSFHDDLLIGRHLWGSLDGPSLGRKYCSTAFKNAIQTAGVIGVQFGACVAA